jgi:hypothetical protein
MAKQAYVYSGTDWVPLASEVTNLSAYQTKALNQFPNRNLVINGDMQIAQRSTSVASLTAGEYRTADRWFFGIDTQGTWTNSIENDAPTGSGFRKSFKVLCTTADASPAAGDALNVQHRFEGQNLQQIKKGTAAAEQLTVSFWVKANVTGTYIVEFYDNDNTRQISKSYTVNASGTWEYKTITIPADTTGAFDNDNALSLYLLFWLGAGSNHTSGTLNSSSWASVTTANRAVGQVNLASATNNYWQVTGVQLEVGATATPFEFLPAQQELAQCQRYYYKMPAGESYQQFGVAYANASTAAQAFTITPVTMRAIPTSLDTGGVVSYFQFSSGSDFTMSNILIGSGQLGTNVIRFYGTVSGATGGSAGWIRANNSTTAYLGFSAEL